MKKHLLIICLFLCGNAFSQSYFPKPINKNVPISNLNHKFGNSVSTSQTNWTAPKHRTCLTTEVNGQLRDMYNLPSIENFEKDFSILKSEFLATQKSQRSEKAIITIPVVVHVIHNGENIGTGSNISVAQIQSQIDVLNEDFRRKSGTSGFNNHPEGADIEIEFAMALRDVNGNVLTEPGIHRVNGNKSFWEMDQIENSLKSQTIWDPKKYLNMWTLNFGGSEESTLGYAQFPNLSGLEGANDNNGIASTDGVVMGYQFFGRTGNLAENFDGGRTATHEIGHWLGLYHIWGDGDCSDDDYCDDTPNSEQSNYGCPTGTNSCSPESGNDAPDMIENYMDYTDDACMNIFTKDQRERMQTVMNVSPRRKELKNSTVHLNSAGPIAYFDSDRTEVCSGEIITFTDESQNSPTSWEWIFLDEENTIVASSTDQNPSITFNEIGIYSLALVVENSTGSDTLYNSNYISVLSSEKINFPFEETFEFENALENWIFYNPDGDRKWEETDIASSRGGSWSVSFDNYSSDDGDPSGKLDAIISPSIDLSTSQDAYLTFDVSYAKFGGEYSDTLIVLASVDCGKNFNPIWTRGGDDLATAPDNEDSFVPSDDSDWRTESISLKELNGFSNVHIALVNKSSWGNNLYLDNISIFVPAYDQPSISNFNTPNDTVSIGSAVNFTDYSTQNPTTWSWEFEGASTPTSTQQNPSVTYNTPGIFDVKLTTSNSSGGNSELKSEYITVIGNPNILITTDPAEKSICIGDSIILEASGADYYEWFDARGSLISENETLTVQPKITSTYEVKGYDNYGGVSSLETEIIVNPLPVFDLGEDVEITVAETVTLDVGKSFSA
jgi:PKD repeat protein